MSLILIIQYCLLKQKTFRFLLWVRQLCDVMKKCSAPHLLTFCSQEIYLDTNGSNKKATKYFTQCLSGIQCNGKMTWRISDQSTAGINEWPL